ncbi:trimeric autotransporter adhesin, partial [Paraburkholderia sp. GV072]
MNKAFRSVWNESTGTWVAAQEDAKGISKNSKPACKSRLSAISWSLGGTAGIALAIFSLPASASVLCLYDNNGKDQVSSNSTFASGCSSRYVPSSDYYALLESGSPSGAAGIVLQAGNITYYLASTMTQNTLTMSVSDTNVLLDGLAPGAVTASSLNAISGSQLYGTASTTAAALGTTMAANGTIVAPGYALPQANAIDGTSGPANNVSSAFATVDTALGKLSDKLSAGIEYFHANSALADSSAIGSEAIAIGGAAAASSGGAIAVGQLSMSNGTAAVAIGQNATATGIANIAIGQRATNAATLNNSIAIGGDSKSGGQSSSLGNSADTSATTFAVAVGHSSVVTGSSGTALGAGASAATANSVALGSNSVANSATLATAGFTPVGGTAISAGTAAGGEVSVGSAGAERRITNVAAGLNATDAVNLSQLMSEDAKVNTINNNVNNLSNTVNNIVNGGGIKYFNANSTLADSSATGTDAVSIGGNAQAPTANSVALGSNSVSNSVSNSTTLTTAGFNPGSSAISAATAAGGEVSVGAAGAERRITNVAAGLNPTDAVNVSQLQSEDAKVNQIGTSTAASLGGGSTYDTTTGTITNPTYSVGGTTVNNVGDALTNLDGRTTQNTTNIDSLTQNINNGTVGLVQQDPTSRNVTVAKDTGGTVVNFTGTAGTRTLTGLTAGDLSATSTDAVNGSQLYATNMNVSNTNNNVANLAGNVTNINNTVNNIVNGGGIKYFNANSTLADSSATGTDAVSIGGNAQATTANSVALGSNSVANSATLATAGFTPLGGTAISAGTAAGGEVSVGSAGAERRITNVAAGLNATDAVNLSQLMSEDAKVNTINNNVNNLSNTVNNIVNGGGIKYFNANSTLADSSATGTDAVAIGGNAQATTMNSVALGSNSVANSTTLATAGFNPGGGAVSAATAAGGEVSVGASGAKRRITNVAAGQNATDAVNVSQLQSEDAKVNQIGTSTASSLGGGSTYDTTTGTITNPAYSVGGTTVNNVGDALTNLDGRTTQNTTNIGSLTQNINNGTVGLVQQDPTSRNVTVAKDTGGTVVNFTGTAGSRTLTGVAAGALNATSVDAVNGSQLYATNLNVSNLTNVVNNISSGGGIKYFNANSTLADSSATGTDAVAIGGNAQATTANSVALGSNSVANSSTLTTAGFNPGSSAISAATAAGGEVSVGASGVERRITNLAAGQNPTDAVNVSQLQSEDAKVNQIGTSTASSLGGGSTYDTTTGTITNPTYPVGGTTVNNVGDALTNLDGRTTQNTTNIGSLTQNINNGTVGLVQQDPTSR